MSPAAITAVLFVALLGLLVTGLPVAFCIMGLSVVGLLVFMGPSALSLLPYQVFANLTQPIYIAIPLFVFMAALLESSGLGAAMYDTMHKWFAGLRGGLAMGTVFICTIIAAMTGLVATAVLTMGLLAYPEMERRGYDKSISLGCIPAGGALGPLIPPSVIMIIVGGFASLSVGKLFMGGVFPGLLMSLLFMLYIGIRCFLKPKLAPALPIEERASWREKFISLRGVILPILLIALILGGIYTGIFTPTEAGGIGAFGALICAAIYRNLNWRNLKGAVEITIKITTMVLWLCIAGSSFAALVSGAGVAKFVSQAMVGLPFGPLGILGVMMGILFIMGMFIEVVPMIMITMPIFLPVTMQLGIDPLWFALLFTIAILIGVITPPYGTSLFYLKGILPPHVKLIDIYRSVLPYVVCMLIVLVIGILWPPLLMWLPNAMIK